MDWKLEDKLQQMEEKEGSYLDIIAAFIREKNIQIENAKQLSSIITRHCRVAKQIEGYSAVRIFKAMDDIKAEIARMEKQRKGSGYDWSLETVWKKLTK